MKLTLGIVRGNYFSCSAHVVSFIYALLSDGVELCDGLWSGVPPGLYLGGVDSPVIWWWCGDVDDWSRAGMECPPCFDSDVAGGGGSYSESSDSGRGSRDQAGPAQSAQY